ncbi:fibronectin type III domain-containing protein [Paenibacillus peoriae]|uniref:fibronectin type III domain-containing protein n=1 Tax=Paenibacillus peoriae TaxID=59893 RepID=UPI00026C59A7|nr:fibronectin type III domain-containing protein [Paenibacillus peoriae]MEC0180312.1 fibronectin type III domain-containing protein [Paenibacillus peoriae]
MKNNIIKAVIMFSLLFLFSGSMVYAADENRTVDGMLGVRPPEGTTVQVSSTASAMSGEYAFDNNLKTHWNSSGYSEYLQLIFPAPVTLKNVQLAVVATPNPSNVNYTIYGQVDGTWVPISSTKKVKVEMKLNQACILPPFDVTPGKYSGIKIAAQSSDTWIAINEITLGKFQTQELTATSGDSQVTLKWDQVENAESYTVKYGTESGKYVETVTATKDSYGNFVIPGLTNGTKYYFVVSAKVNGVDSEYSNEASATPQAGEKPDPEQPSGNRAILTVTMTTGLEKEFDLSLKEVNDFIAWYDTKDAGRGASFFAIDKHNNNKGPFGSRKDYMLYDRILTFEVSEYTK